VNGNPLRKSSSGVSKSIVEIQFWCFQIHCGNPFLIVTNSVLVNGNPLKKSSSYVSNSILCVNANPSKKLISDVLPTHLLFVCLFVDDYSELEKWVERDKPLFVTNPWQPYHHAWTDDVVDGFAKRNPLKQGEGIFEIFNSQNSTEQ
jgi:hypothetical protein